MCRYDSTVSREPHTFRLRPRTNCAQRLLSFEIQIAPTPSGTTECLYQDGNYALDAWFDSPAQVLSVLSQFSVEMLRENPFDFILTGDSVELPLRYPDPLRTALAPYLNDAHVAEAVKSYAKSIAVGARSITLSFLSTLNEHLFRRCRQVIRPEGPPISSEITLSSLEGACRDVAVLLCDVCRVMGIAARFVSGYESEAGAQQESYMHAWAEVYLPGAGWRGYDPFRGVAVSTAHVAVAAGFHHDLARPIAGLYRGGSRSHMEASLNLRVDPNFCGF